MLTHRLYLPLLVPLMHPRRGPVMPRSTPLAFRVVGQGRLLLHVTILQFDHIFRFGFAECKGVRLDVFHLVKVVCDIVPVIA